MYIYSYVGDSVEYKTDTRRRIPADAVRMNGPRPGGDYVADENGDWVLFEATYTVQESIKKMETLIQKRLDDFAQTLTYGSILSACTYATSTTEMYAIEGQYCVEARDNTWNAAYAILDSMTGEVSTDVTFTESELTALWTQIEAQLPELKWPEGSRGYMND